MDYSSIEALTTRQIQDILRSYKLPVYYKKKVFIMKRLYFFLSKSQKPHASNSKDNDILNVSVLFDKNNLNLDMSNSEGESEEQMANFTFKEVEDSLESFSGEGHRKIVLWLKSFEEVAVVCNWGDVQKYLYCRKLLTGAARAAVESAEDCTSYAKLKLFLVDKFNSKVLSIDVHQKLAATKKDKGETYLEYFFKMFQIAKMAEVDEKSVLEYIISGIDDTPVNKSVLYTANNQKEFREKLTVYEKIKNDTKKVDPNSKRYFNSNDHQKLRCKNCGSFSHKTYNCPDKSKGARGFNCDEFGHLSSNCPKKVNRNSGHSSKPLNSSASVNTIMAIEMHVNVFVQDTAFIALLDTGSDITLMKESIFRQIYSVKKLCGQPIIFTGIGSKVMKTFGSCNLNIKVGKIGYDVEVHVIDDKLIREDILLGKNILAFLDIRIRNGNIFIDGSDGNDKINDANYVLLIDVENLYNDTDTVKDMIRISHINDISVKQSLVKTVCNYDPKKQIKSCVEMNIVLQDEEPVFQTPRRLANVERQIVQNQVQEWLKDGIIQNSYSNYASPIVLVKKKNGSHRLCIDYRKVNKKIIKERYPLPIIEEVLENLYDANYFTTLTLKNGFFHVDICDPSKKFTAFVTPDGHYEFLKVPFGLCNSPSVFQRFINTVFSDLIRNSIIQVYMDDIVIPSKTVCENFEKFKMVLNIAEENGLLIRWEKCNFIETKITFLGHIITNGSIQPSEEKTIAIKNFPIPKNVKAIQSFLGLAGVFRKFINNFSLIAKPLSDLTKKDAKFNFGEEQFIAFNTLKEKLCNDPLLKLYNPHYETELHTDASSFGYGACLMQKHSDVC